MAISSLSIVDPNQRASSGSNIGIEDFLKILTTQLNNQDPLKPVDNQEFVAQIAQFTNLEQIRQLNVKTESLLQVGAANQAAGLLEKTVAVKVSSTQEVTGVVKKVVFKDSTPFFDVQLPGGQFVTDVSLSQLLRIGA